LPSTRAAIIRARSDRLKRFMHYIMHEPLKHVNTFIYSWNDLPWLFSRRHIPIPALILHFPIRNYHLQATAGASPFPGTSPAGGAATWLDPFSSGWLSIAFPAFSISSGNSSETYAM
jgi:hypothetical protein